jgi:hypothetical protein
LNRLKPDQQTNWFRTRHIGYIIMTSLIERDADPRVALAKAAIQQMRTDPAHFRLIKRVTMARLSGQGHEWAEFYEVVTANNGGGASKPPETPEERKGP